MVMICQGGAVVYLCSASPTPPELMLTMCDDNRDVLSLEWVGLFVQRWPDDNAADGVVITALVMLRWAGVGGVTGV